MYCCCSVTSRLREKGHDEDSSGLTEMGYEENDTVERTGGEWMVLLLGLCGDTTARMIDAVKMFLEKMWSMRRGQ